MLTDSIRAGLTPLLNVDNIDRTILTRTLEESVGQLLSQFGRALRNDELMAPKCRALPLEAVPANREDNEAAESALVLPEPPSPPILGPMQLDFDRTLKLVEEINSPTPWDFGDFFTADGFGSSGNDVQSPAQQPIQPGAGTYSGSHQPLLTIDPGLLQSANNRTIDASGNLFVNDNRDHVTIPDRFYDGEMKNQTSVFAYPELLDNEKLFLDAGKENVGMRHTGYKVEHPTPARKPLHCPYTPCRRHSSTRFRGRQHPEQLMSRIYTDEVDAAQEAIPVNAKQFLRILKRRVACQKLEEHFQSKRPCLVHVETLGSLPAIQPKITETALHTPAAAPALPSTPALHDPPTRRLKCDRIHPYTGRPCNLTFSRPYDMTRHEDSIHERRSTRVKCLYCAEVKTFSRDQALTRHMRVVHPDIDSHRRRPPRGGRVVGP